MSFDLAGIEVVLARLFGRPIEPPYADGRVSATPMPVRPSRQPRWGMTDDDIDRFVAEWGRIFERAGKTRAAE